MGATLSNLLSALTAASCCALVALGLSGLVPMPALAGPWPWTAVGAGLGIALYTVTTSRYKKLYQSVNRYLDAMARIDVRAPLVPNDFPRLPAGHPLEQKGSHLWNSFATLSERVQDVEQSRAAIEIRCRRAQQEAERIRAIFTGLSEPILAIDRYDELVMANRSAEELFAFSGNAVAQRAVQQIVRSQKLIELLTGTARRKSSTARTEEIELTDADGQAHWFKVTAAKLDSNANDSDGQGAVAVLRDISDRKVLQKRNAEFVSSVSHEMKTPLAGIKAYVELLADGEAEDEATREEFLGIINGQTDRLQRLIDNLLNLARIEAGVVQVHKQPCSLNDILEEALRVVRPGAEAKQIELLGDLSPLYLSVLADRDMLLQSAINLLSNAIKYTRPGGKVTLRSRMADEEIRFEVEDTGVGLSGEDCSKVFEKFYRVKKDKEMAAGTGLGLPLAKHIVEDVHGGRIVVESELGKGSTFAVVLPHAGQHTQ